MRFSRKIIFRMKKFPGKKYRLFSKVVRMNWKLTQDVRKHVQVIALRFWLPFNTRFLNLYIFHHLRVQTEVLFHKYEKFFRFSTVTLKKKNLVVRCGIKLHESTCCNAVTQHFDVRANHLKITPCGHFFNDRGVCLCWRKYFCGRLWVLINSTHLGDHFVKVSEKSHFSFSLCRWPQHWSPRGVTHRSTACVLTPSVKWKRKLRSFWNFHKMISWVSRVD